MSKILRRLKELYINTRGFHTRRHLLVIESDDWGSIRMPSLEIFNNLRSIGDNPEDDAFLSNDCLENKKDLLALYDVLNSVKDVHGCPAVITANYVMANPDFENIDYNKSIYRYEPFYKTYERYYPNDRVLDVVKEGIKSKCFFPQLHCREHLNVNRWMKALKNCKKDAVIAFDHKMIGIGASFSKDNIFGYMDAFNTDLSTDKELEDILSDASEIFFKVFGYKSRTFVASCFVWREAFEKSLFGEGIIGIQSSEWQNVPSGNFGEYKLNRKLHYTGEINKLGQVYTVRNCTYEPAYCQDAFDSADYCLSSVRDSFKNNKPAIINSHRFNYISSINPQNAERNLEGLGYLLSTIKKEYKDVEFITSSRLVDIIKEDVRGN